MPEVQAYELSKNSPLSLPAIISRISAGDVSDVEPYFERIDLNELLSRGSDGTLLLRIKGDSMEDVPIANGDFVILDRLKHPESGNIIIAYLNGGFTIKRHKVTNNGNKLFLVPANSEYQTREIKPSDDFEILGVVTFIIHPSF